MAHENKSCFNVAEYFRVWFEGSRLDELQNFPLENRCKICKYYRHVITELANHGYFRVWFEVSRVDVLQNFPLEIIARPAIITEDKYARFGYEPSFRSWSILGRLLENLFR